MKKGLFLLLTLPLVASAAFAGDFAPTAMTISSAPVIQYDFDGSKISFPVTVTGTPAAIWLVINTKDMGPSISAVRNGYLGWHYVNKIDTTIYISQKYSLTIGTSPILWDGKDENGNNTVVGNYNYYLWAYDDKTPRQSACKFMMIGYDWESQFIHIIEKGEDGQPLSNPMLFGSHPWWLGSSTREIDYSPWSITINPAHGIVKKWILGSDPVDSSLLQTSRMGIFDPDKIDLTYGGPVLNPPNYNIFYEVTRDFNQQISTIMKWEFVPGGAAVQDLDWGGWDNVTLEDHGAAIGVWSQQPSCYTDGNYIYQVSPGLWQKNEEWNKLLVYSFNDGSVVMDKMMSEWYMPDDPNPNGYINGAFHFMYSRTPNNWFLLSYTSCMHEMINTTRLVANPDDETDIIMFRNSNGDYFMDSAYAQNAEPAWYCLSDGGNGENASLRRDSIAIDRNGFNVIGLSYLGLMSFGVSTQDGTGIGYMQFADDTIPDNKDLKGGGLLLDNGSAFDGLYYCGPLKTDSIGWVGDGVNEAYFVASDSFKGIITSALSVAVEEEAPAVFSVAQNSPNPFNPATTINFSIPKADRVIVEVFNIAGQKVSTLVNGHLSAGNHSVVWNASGKSAGVFFYTVKAGNFSKTMKMTLLK